MAKDLGKQLEMQLALNAAIKERQDLLKQQNSLLQNQATLEKQLSSMYGDKARDTSTLANNMRDMAKEAEKSGRGAQDHNKNISEQIRLADQLRKSQDKSNKKSEESRKESEKQAATWNDVAKAAKDYFETVIKKYPKAIGAIVGMQRALKDVATTFKSIGGLIGSVVKGAFNIGKAILALPFKMIQGIAKMQRKMAEEAQPLRDAIEGVRKSFGGLNSEMGSKVVAATKKFSMSAKQAALGGRSIMSIFGYRSAGKAKFIEAVNKTMSGLKKLGPMIARTFGPEKQTAIFGMQSAFDLSDQALSGFVKSAELMGKDSVDSMNRAVQAASNMKKGTGLSTKDVMQGIGEMKADFVSFGHLSTEEMAAATISVKQFGGTIKDLKAVQDKFMNFEGAANSLSTLNQAFGMQIDALDMLKAKNPAEQIDKMRQAFFATGRSIDDLNMHEKKLLQSQTGLSDEMMRSAFNASNQGKSYDDLNRAAEKNKKKKLDQTKVLKELADALSKFTGLGQDLSGTGDALGKGFSRAISLHPAMRSLMATTRKFLLEVRALGWDLGNLLMDMLADTGVIGGFEDLLNAGAFKQFRTDVIDAMKDLAKFISGGPGDPELIADKIIRAFEDLGSTQGGKINRLFIAFQKLGKVLMKLFGVLWEKFIGPALGKMFKALGKYLWDNRKPIMNAIWPVFAVILGWVMLKAVVGAALGKAATMLMTKLFAGRAAAAAGTKLVSTVAYSRDWRDGSRRYRDVESHGRYVLTPFRLDSCRVRSC